LKTNPLIDAMITIVCLMKYISLNLGNTLASEPRNLNAVELKDSRQAPLVSGEPEERRRVHREGWSLWVWLAGLRRRRLQSGELVQALMPIIMTTSSLDAKASGRRDNRLDP
jgi:hypothetical protein